MKKNPKKAYTTPDTHTVNVNTKSLFAASSSFCTEEVGEEVFIGDIEDF